MEEANFEYISNYYNNIDKTKYSHIVSDNTCTDIDFEALFSFCDRTSSKVGQQYLYSRLRCVDKDRNRIIEQENLIENIQKQNIINDIKKQLKRLNSFESYYLCRVFQDDPLPKDKYLKLTQILPFISMISIALTIYIHTFIVLLIPIMILNMIIHYRNKESLLFYSEVFTQLAILESISRKLKDLGYGNEQDDSIKKLKIINKQTRIIRLQNKVRNDFEIISWATIELVKICLSLEAFIFNRVMSQIQNNKKGIESLYENIGKIDLAISTISLRETLPYYCKPDITNYSKKIKACEIFHPLIDNCVSNNINIDERSTLITGSNMSGKTTFIRTMAVSVLTANTINTCFAKSMSLGNILLDSAIKISDSLLNDKSYYFEEVLRIKSMIENAKSGKTYLLLLDELYKGTNTIERIACAKSVLSYLNKENIVIASTHDTELCELLKDDYDIYHFGERIIKDVLSFDYTIKSGKPTETNAIRILDLNEYPKEIIDESYKIAKEIA